jgi:hypothetical protein
VRWLVVLCLAACTRDPIDTCAPIEVGELVVTEVRGDADAANGSWVELFNASGRTLDLAGVKIRFRLADGSGETPILVRHELTVGAGEYIVLGRYFDDTNPAHIDYGFRDDFDGSWLGAAAIEVQACGERVDVAQYSALPDEGSFSLGVAPDHELNDIAESWCFDVTPEGTPGAANTPCP